MGDREQPDVGAALTIARDNLRRIRESLELLAEDIYAHDSTGEAGRKAADHWQVPWQAAGPIQKAYTSILVALGRAHWELADDTFVSELWLQPWARPTGPDWRPDWLRVPTLPLEDAQEAVDILDAALAELQADKDLRPPEQNAAVKVAGMLKGIIHNIPKGFEYRPEIGKRCRVRWCNVGIHAKGFCQEHYDQERRAS